METGYERSCQTLHGKDLPILSITGCELKVMEVMVPCSNATDAQMRGREAALPAPAKVIQPTPPVTPTPEAKPFPPLSARERAFDKAALARLHQRMVNVCNNLCGDPSDAGVQYDVFCGDRREAEGIQDKYALRGEPAPDAHDDVRSDPCGWEFYNDIMENRKGMCFGRDGATETRWARWFQGRAGGLNEKYHPPRTPAPSPGGGLDRGGGGRDGGGRDRCQPPCTDNGPGKTCSCPSKQL